MKNFLLSFFSVLLFVAASCQPDDENVNPVDNLPDISGYPIVGTNQTVFYDANNEITAPSVGQAFYGQNAHYPGTTPRYEDNGNGTLTDQVTGLMWSQSPDMNEDGQINVDDKMTFDEAKNFASSYKMGGFDDWRLPTIKELYSLIQFNGIDPSGYEGTSTTDLKPFIDSEVYEFGYGDTDAGERVIDAQFATSNLYLDSELLFGVNFADGRIKGYGLEMPFGNIEKTFYVYYVRGRDTYGQNDFNNNNNGTITDEATSLMWMANDSGEGMTWEEALEYAENFEFAGFSDWRLPDVKELQSIVDYTRAPNTTNSAAIDPLFFCTEITNEAGEPDYPFYWSNTTHANWSDVGGANAAYVSFGRALGYINGWEDVHGAGAQRSDPKMGDPSDYPTGNGPQGDAIRIYNYVRLVRNK